MSAQAAQSKSSAALDTEAPQQGQPSSGHSNLPKFCRQFPKSSPPFNNGTCFAHSFSADLPALSVGQDPPKITTTAGRHAPQPPHLVVIKQSKVKIRRQAFQQYSALSAQIGSININAAIIGPQLPPYFPQGLLNFGIGQSRRRDYYRPWLLPPDLPHNRRQQTQTAQHRPANNIHADIQAQPRHQPHPQQPDILLYMPPITGVVTNQLYIFYKFIFNTD